MYNNPEDHLFDEIVRRDQELYSLATYEVAHGRIMVFSDPEKMMDIKTKVADKYNYFKTLIQKGECSFDFIKKTVLMKNGAVLQDLTMDQYIKDIIDDSCTDNTFGAIGDGKKSLAPPIPSPEELSQAETALANMFFDSIMKAIDIKKNHPFPPSKNKKEYNERDREEIEDDEEIYPSDDYPFDDYPEDDDLPF